MTKKDLNSIISQWLQGSDDAWGTFLILKKSKQFGPALFFLHLSLEKAIKALVVKSTKDHAPYSHNLEYLMGRAGIDLTEQNISELNTITSFNFTGRYPEEKNDFYRNATKETVSKWQSVTQLFIDMIKAKL